MIQAEEFDEIKELIFEVPECKVSEFKGELEHEEENHELTEPNDSPFRVRRLSRSFSIIPDNHNPDNDPETESESHLTSSDDVLLSENDGEEVRKSKFIVLKRSRSLGNIFVPNDLGKNNKNDEDLCVNNLTEKVEALEIEVLNVEKEEIKETCELDSVVEVEDDEPRISLSKMIDRPQTSPPVLSPSILHKKNEDSEDEPTTKLSILERMQKSLGFFFQCARKDENDQNDELRFVKYQMRSRTPDARMHKHEKMTEKMKILSPPPTSEIPVQAVDFVTKIDDSPKCEEMLKKLPQFHDIPGPKGPLLCAQSVRNEGRKCLVLDLDETLVHSSFHAPEAHDLIVTLNLPDGAHQNIYVAKRPGVDEFLARMSEKFEVVIFTASLAHYADPVIDFLASGMNRYLKEPLGIDLRLYRESCLFLRGLYVKDLSRLGRKLDQTVIVDNSPASFLLQPDHGIPIKSWFSDTSDRELSTLQASLMHLIDAESVANWREKLDSF